MEKDKYLAVQAFRIENKQIVLDNLPVEVYDNIEKNIPKFYETIDTKAWLSEIISPDNTKYYVIMSRNTEAVTEFMNVVMFTEDILNKSEAKND